MTTQLKTTSVPDAVYNALREQILSTHIEPGGLVTETAIALEFGVARPTAKAALERLVAEGLLTRRAHKTARVPQLNRDDIVDLFENRAIVESAAVAALASQPEHGRVPELARAAHRRLMGQARSNSSFAQEDIAFHHALVSGQSSSRLVRMHSLLMGEIELCIGQVQAHHLLTAHAVANQHQGILDAVAAGDAALAARLTREHIDGSRDRLLDHYDSTHP